MPRYPGISLAGVSLYLIQRGNNRQACSHADRVYLRYLECLDKNARLCSCRMTSYVPTFR